MVFIYHFEENQIYSPLTFSIFESLEKGNFKGITSILTLLEILVKPKKENNSLLTERYKLLFETFPNLQVKTLNENIADIASTLRASYNINTPDAIQIATSLEVKADIFITNDATLKKISEIKVLLLNEMLKQTNSSHCLPRDALLYRDHSRAPLSVIPAHAMREYIKRQQSSLSEG